MSFFGFNYNIANFFQKLKGLDEKNRTELLVGSVFEKIGEIEKKLLEEFGLSQDSFIVDIGCGGGRLGVRLKEMPNLKYSGFDVVSDFIDYAKNICQRPDWNFQTITSTKLPLEDNSADFFVFFSVFTHLKEEIIIEYLIESNRVLKKNGKVILSFLDPEVEHHNKIVNLSFWQNLKQKIFYPHNFTHSKEHVKIWAEKFGFNVLKIESPHLIGQSIAVFEKI